VYGEKGGLHLASKAKLQDGTKVKGSYSLQREVLSVTGEWPRDKGGTMARGPSSVDVSCRQSG
jgi:hypothetical protein